MSEETPVRRNALRRSRTNAQRIDLRAEPKPRNLLPLLLEVANESVPRCPECEGHITTALDHKMWCRQVTIDDIYDAWCAEKEKKRLEFDHICDDCLEDQEKLFLSFNKR